VGREKRRVFCAEFAQKTKVVRKGQAYKMPKTDIYGCPVGFALAGQPLTGSEQRTLSAKPQLGSQGLLP
jgi:hypothetical protein